MLGQHNLESIVEPYRATDSDVENGSDEENASIWTSSSVDEPSSEPRESAEDSGLLAEMQYLSTENFFR
jgi:hypothetical protein